MTKYVDKLNNHFEEYNEQYNDTRLQTWYVLRE